MRAQKEWHPPQKVGTEVGGHEGWEKEGNILWNFGSVSQRKEFQHTMPKKQKSAWCWPLRFIEAQTNTRETTMTFRVGNEKSAQCCGGGFWCSTGGAVPNKEKKKLTKMWTPSKRKKQKKKKSEKKIKTRKKRASVKMSGFSPKLNFGHIAAPHSIMKCLGFQVSVLGF